VGVKDSENPFFKELTLNFLFKRVKTGFAERSRQTAAELPLDQIEFFASLSTQ
jgi:hypothetical protein